MFTSEPMFSYLCSPMGLRFIPIILSLLFIVYLYSKALLLIDLD